MNKENILRVADAIEKHELRELGFNMATYYEEVSEEISDQSGHSCGTVGCIAGWAVAIRRRSESDNSDTINLDNEYDFFDDAATFFGLGTRAASDLFVPIGIGLHNVKPERAVRTLRHLAKTGEVRWTFPEA